MSFSLDKTVTTSPREKSPLTLIIPAGNKLLPFFRAFKAPSSMITVPIGFIVPTIHCFLDARGVLEGLNQVQGLFLNSAFIGLLIVPFVIAIWHPAAIAVFAAEIFVFIPPFPSSDTESPTMFSISSLISVISEINLILSLFFGSDEYNPFIFDSNIKQSELVIWATLDASLSLSPYLISLVAIVSFSLTIGIIPILRRVSNVLLALIDLLLCSVSSKVRRI